MPPRSFKHANGAACVKAMSHFSSPGHLHRNQCRFTLSLALSVCLYVCLPTYQPTYLSTYLPICPSRLIYNHLYLSSLYHLSMCTHHCKSRCIRRSSQHQNGKASQCPKSVGFRESLVASRKSESRGSCSWCCHLQTKRIASIIPST